mgnify:FL=1
MKGVILDYDTLGPEDISITQITDQLDHWDVFGTTSKEQILDRLHDVDVVVVNKVLLARADLAQLPELKLIVVAATGTNNVDLVTAKEFGIKVCNVTGYGTATVVQHTFTLMLALASNLLSYESDARNGKWAGSNMFCLMDYPIVELEGKVLGIVGYGELGRSLERLASAFGMEVKIAQRPGAESKSGRLPLKELLPQVDFLSIHCLLSEQTKDLIDEAAIRSMKPGAFLINTARGGIVNEQAAYKALVDGHLAGAAFDVLTQEPPQAGNILLPKHPIPNLIVTPHCAWASKEARQRLVCQVAANILAFLAGKPRNLV